MEAKYVACCNWPRTSGARTRSPGLDDVHGLIMDANFVGLPGNYKFFTDKDRRRSASRAA